jgi:hypothetical protein
MILGALVGGFVGTLVLTSTVRLAQIAGLTRMDLPLLLGTAFTGHRARAAAIGYVVHLLNGLAFALVYAAVFAVVGREGILLGMALGMLHAAFAGGVLVNVLLPAVHPRMGKTWSDARRTPLLEPPGFMLLNYGRASALVSVVGHVAYGGIVGLFAAAA